MRASVQPLLGCGGKSMLHFEPGTGTEHCSERRSSACRPESERGNPLSAGILTEEVSEVVLRTKLGAASSMIEPCVAGKQHLGPKMGVRHWP
eukprot:860577-Pelagomonas_calceolata.AAC.3